MPEYPPVPNQPPRTDSGLLAAWFHAAVHVEEIDWIMGRIAVSPYLELEPPRRPPSWYPGQPEPPKPRRRACTCFYGLREVRGVQGPYEPVGSGFWLTRCFVIVFDCPHHGDDRYDPDQAHPCSGCDICGCECDQPCSWPCPCYFPGEGRHH